MRKLFRCFALLIVATMLLTVLAACAKKGDQSQESHVAVSTNEENAEYFKVKQTNWGVDFNVLAPKWGLYENYFAYNEQLGQGDHINQALFQRTTMVKDYLGVNLIYNLVVDNTSSSVTYVMLQTAVSAGDDSYQLYQTHVYHNLPTIATQGYVYDLTGTNDNGETLFPDINLDAPYWNTDAMRELEMGGALYYGHSDYMLSNPTVIFFNKTIREDHGVSDLYEMVNNGTWTLQNMIIESKKITDQGDASTEKYGFAAVADYQFISFMDSCETNVIIEENGIKKLNMGANNERFSSVLDMINDLCGAKSSYVYWEGGASNIKKGYSIKDGRVLFTLVDLSSAHTYRDSGVKFGILPYPKYDQEQTEYHSFDWSGFMCVPSSATNTVMIGQVLETLSYYSADTLHIAYYEKLLGSKISDAPDDYSMLQTIYSSICTNPIVNLQPIDSGSWGTGLSGLVYTYTFVAQSNMKTNPTAKINIASHWAANKDKAQKAIDDTLNS